MATTEQKRKKQEDARLKAAFQEKVKVPDSLLPENMEKRLAQMDLKRVQGSHGRNYSRYVRRAAVILAVVLLVGGLAAGGIVGFHQKSNALATSGGVLEKLNGLLHASDEAADTQLASSNYGKAYALFCKVKQEQEAYENETNSYRANGEDAYEYEDSATAAEDSASAADAQSASATGYSTTNVRTQGVDEADIVKTDGKYIYEYNSSTEHIRIYRADSDSLESVGDINLNSYGMEVGESGFYVQDGVLVLSGTVADEAQEQPVDSESGWKNMEEDDSKTQEIAVDVGGDAWCTRTLLFDVTDPESPSFLHGFFQDGGSYTTRLSDGVFYVISTKYMNYYAIEYDKEETYIPKVEGNVVGEDDVIVQEGCQDTRYTVVSAISLTDLKYIGQKAVLGGTERVYMSDSAIYLADSIYSDSKTTLQLLRLTYDKGTFTDVTRASTQGELCDDYSIDEYKGYLRLVTTYEDGKGNEKNGLFVFDQNLKQVGCLKNLAENESIYSARFLEDTVYFVTYRNTDPLFAVDVSDPEHPKLLSYLKIPGFSTYLHPYRDGLLLGIGKETDEDGVEQGVKLSLFDISDPQKVKEVAKLVLPEYSYADVMYNPNALLFDSENQRFGLTLYGEDEDEVTYGMFSYDEKKGFVQELDVTLSDSDSAGSFVDARGVYIGDRYYIVNVGIRIAVLDRETLEKQKIWKEK